MDAKKIGTIVKGQDGAMYGGYLFRFDSKGTCTVYRTHELTEDSAPVSQFTLDKVQWMLPHSNSVAFGPHRYCETDEFPLLYSNVYNSYSKVPERREGITCVYRLQRSGNHFQTTLVQLIEVGFTADPIWKSETCRDVRPYGNFAIDNRRGLYYAFTMRDAEPVTRFFAFPLPAPGDGVPDPETGVLRVVLGKDQLLRTFDCPYQHYIQGACLEGDLIYSLEGFTASAENPPAIRIIDTLAGKEQQAIFFGDYGMTVEPEWIDFSQGICYYADHDGNVYTLTF